MVKIIVAFATNDACAKYASILEEAGIPVFRCCTSASEVKRTINQCGGGIVLSCWRLPDSTVDALAYDLGGQALIIAAGRPEQLQMCEHPEIFRLSFPCSRGALTSAINMLIQFHQMRLPQRSAREKQIVAQAKALLMRKFSMTEPEAHHSLQKGAMDQGMKLADFAAKLLEMNEPIGGSNHGNHPATASDHP